MAKTTGDSSVTQKRCSELGSGQESGLIFLMASASCTSHRTEAHERNSQIRFEVVLVPVVREVNHSACLLVREVNSLPSYGSRGQCGCTCTCLFGRKGPCLFRTLGLFGRGRAFSALLSPSLSGFPQPFYSMRALPAVSTQHLPGFHSSFHFLLRWLGNRAHSTNKGPNSTETCVAPQLVAPRLRKIRNQVR